MNEKYDANPTTEFVRIAWNIQGHEGHGSWYEGRHDHQVLQRHLREANARHGTRTHRLERRNGNDALAIVRHALLKAMNPVPK